MAIYHRSEDGSREYWIAQRKDLEGDIILAQGLTEDQAEWDVERQLKERNDFLLKPPMEKLKILCSEKDICSRNMQMCLKLIYKILEENNENKPIEKLSPEELGKKYPGVPILELDPSLGFGSAVSSLRTTLYKTPSDVQEL